MTADPGTGAQRAADDSPTVEDGIVVEGGPVVDPVMTTRVADARQPLRAGSIARAAREAVGGIAAIGVKELRGRMRGRRAFVILTVYLLLLGAFAWMMELVLEKETAGGLGGTAAFASAQVGRGIFIALMMLETLLVVALAPAFTAGAISMEREKQTLDLLATTPISSLAIVIGKLFSALTYLFILVFASIPMTAIVFVFGGVAPDDVVRGYAVLVVTALGLGAMGLFFSALVQRTQAATILSYFTLLALTLGTFFVADFWNRMTADGLGPGVGPIQGRPPQALVWLNPYYAQADVMCGVENGFGEWCNRLATVTERPVFGGIEPPTPVPDPAGRGVQPGIEPGVDKPVADVIPFGVVRDSFWPRSAISWLVVSAVLVLVSVQLVSPTRRWRPRFAGLIRRSNRRIAA